MGQTKILREIRHNQVSSVHQNLTATLLQLINQAGEGKTSFDIIKERLLEGDIRTKNQYGSQIFQLFENCFLLKDELTTNPPLKKQKITVYNGNILTPESSIIKK